MIDNPKEPDLKDALKEEVKKFLHSLRERYDIDSGSVFVTLSPPDGTAHTWSYTDGIGNWYARIGHVNEWIINNDQYQRNWAIREDKKRHPEEE